MSELLDERVVEMRFDNTDFERNVGQSIKTIDRLKESLDFEDAGSSFDNLAESAAKIDLSPLEKSIDSISVKFNMLELIAANVLGNIVNKAVDAGTRLAKSVSVDQITAGWKKYEQKTASVQTIIAATGESIDTVNSKLEKLIWFADETSYDFVDMVNNIGKFTSAGVDLDKAVNSMMGISNWAAVSGAGIQQASRAMYNLSQSIGMGYVAISDWRSIELANMATQEFKELAITMGLNLGTLKEMNGQVTTLDGKVAVTAETMRESLKKKWFTSDVLNETLAVYSDIANKVKEFQELKPEFATVSEALDQMFKEGGWIDLEDPFENLGYKAFIAAQEAKTLTEAINATKDAVSSGWMRTFELIFGNYDQAKKLWTNLANDMYDIFAAPGAARNDKLADIMKSNYQKLLDEMPDPDAFNTTLYNKLFEYVKNTSGEEYASDLFSRFETLEDLLKNTKYFGSELQKIFYTIFGDNAKEERKLIDLSQSLKKKEISLRSAAIKLASGQYGKEEEAARKEVEKLGFNYDELLEFAEMYKNGIEIDWDAAQKNFEKGLDEQIKSLQDFRSKIEKYMFDNKLLESLGEFGGRDKLIGGLENIMLFFKNLYLLLLDVGDGFISLFGSGSGSFIGKAIDGFSKLTDVLGIAGAGFVMLQDVVDVLFHTSIPNAWDKLLHGYYKPVPINELIGGGEAPIEEYEHIPGLIDRITNYYKEHLQTLPAEVQKTINTITGNVTEFFDSIPKKVKEIKESIFGIEEQYNAVISPGQTELRTRYVGGMINEWKEKLNSFGDGIIPKTLDGITKFLDKISGFLFEYEDETGEIEGAITWIFDKVSAFINLLKDIGKSAKDIFGTVFSDIKTFFAGGKYSFSDSMIWALPARIKKHFEDLKKSQAYQDVKAFFFGKDFNKNTFGQGIHIPGLFDNINKFVKGFIESKSFIEIKRFILGDEQSKEPSIFGRIFDALKNIQLNDVYKTIKAFFFGDETTKAPNIFERIDSIFKSIEESAPFKAVKSVIDFLTGKINISTSLGSLSILGSSPESVDIKKNKHSKVGEELIKKLFGFFGDDFAKKGIFYEELYKSGDLISLIFGGDVKTGEHIDAEGNIIETITEPVDGIITEIINFVNTIPDRLSTAVTDTKNKIFQIIGSIFGYDTNNLAIGAVHKDFYEVNNDNLINSLKDEYKERYKTISEIVKDYGSLFAANDAGIFKDNVDISVINDGLVKDNSLEVILKDEFKDKYQTIQDILSEFGGDINAAIKSGIFKDNIEFDVIDDQIYAAVLSITKTLPGFTNLEDHVNGWIDNIFGGFIGDIRSKIPNLKEGILELLGNGLGVSEDFYLLFLKHGNLRERLEKYYDENWEELAKHRIDSYDDFLNGLKFGAQGKAPFQWLYQDVSSSVFEESLLPFSDFIDRFSSYIDIYKDLFKYGFSGNITYFKSAMKKLNEFVVASEGLGESNDNLDNAQSSITKLGSAIQKVREIVIASKDKIIEFGKAAFTAVNDFRKWLGLDWKFNADTNSWERQAGAIDTVYNTIKSIVDSKAFQAVKKFLLGDEKSKEPNIFGKISNAITSITGSKAFQAVKKFLLGDEKSKEPNIFGKISNAITSITGSKAYKDVKEFLFGKNVNIESFGQADHIPGFFEKIILFFKDLPENIQKAKDGILDFFLGPINEEGLRTEHIFVRLPGYIDAAKEKLLDFFLGKKVQKGTIWDKELQQRVPVYEREGSLIDRLKEKIDQLREKYPELEHYFSSIENFIEKVKEKYDLVKKIIVGEDTTELKRGGFGFMEVPKHIDGFVDHVAKIFDKINIFKPKDKKSFLERLADAFIGTAKTIQNVIRIPSIIHRLAPVFLAIGALMIGIGGINIMGLNITSPLENMVDMLTDIVKSVAIMVGLLVGLSLYLRFLDGKGWVTLAAAAGIITVITGALVGIALIISGFGQKSSGIIEGFKDAAALFMMISFLRTLVTLVATLGVVMVALSITARIFGPGNVLAAAAAIGTIIASIGLLIYLMNKNFDKAKDGAGKLHTHAGELFMISSILFNIGLLISTIIGAFTWLYFLTKGKSFEDLAVPLTILGMTLAAVAGSIIGIYFIVKKLSNLKPINKSVVIVFFSLEAFILALMALAIVLTTGKNINDWQTLLSAFGGIALVMLAMAGCLKIISKINNIKTQNIWALVGILAALSLVVAGFSILKNIYGVSIDPVDIFNIIVAIGEVAGSLILLGGIIKAIQSIKLTKRSFNAFYKVLLALGSLALAVSALALIAMGLKINSCDAILPMLAAIGEVAVTMIAIAGVIKAIQKIHLTKKSFDAFYNILLPLASLAIAVGVLAGIAFVANIHTYDAILPMLAAIAEVAVTMGIVALAIKAIQKINISQKDLLIALETLALMAPIALAVWGLSALANVANIHTGDAIIPMLLSIAEVAGTMVITAVAIAAAGFVGEIINKFLPGVLSALIGFGVLALGVWGLAALANKANIHTWNAILPMLIAINDVAFAMVIASGALVIAGFLGSIMDGMILGVLTAIGGFTVLAFAVWGLAAIANKANIHTYDAILPMLAAIGEVAAAMVVTSGLLAIAGLLGTAVIALIPGVIAAVAGFAILALAVWGLSKLTDEIDAEQLNEVSEILTGIARTFGEMIGAFIGGIGEGLTGSLPTIGENISAFMTNLQPFLDAVKGLDDSYTDGATNFMKIMGTIVADEAMGWLATLFDNFTGDKIKTAQNLGDFITELEPFLSRVALLTESSLKGAEYFTGIMMTIVGDEALGWLATLFDNFTGDKVSTAKNLGDFITELEPFLNKITGLTDAHKTGAEMLTAIMGEIVKENALAALDNIIKYFCGTTDYSKFTGSLDAIADGIISVNNKFNQNGITKDIVENDIALIRSVLDLVTDSKYKSGGLAGIFDSILNGEADFKGLFDKLNTEIADGLVEFCSNIKGVETGDAEKAVEILPKIFDMLSDDHYRSGGIGGWIDKLINGETNFQGMFDVLLGIDGKSGLIDRIRELSEKLQSKTFADIDYSLIINAVDAMKDIFELMSFDTSDLITDTDQQEEAWGSYQFFNDADKLYNALGVLRQKVVPEIKQLQKDLKDAGVDSDYISDIISSYSGLIQSLVDLSQFEGMIGAPEIGNFIIEGLINALRDGETRVRDAASSVADAVKSGLTLTLKIESPSKVAYEIGQFVAQGLTNGLLAGEPLVWTKARELGEGTIKALQEGAARYDQYGLAQHAINMVTEDLVDENRFNMPDFSFINHLGMEDIDFEKMRSFLHEKFSDVFEPDMIDGFVNTYMHEWNKLPKRIEDANYAKVMTDIAKGEFGSGQDAIIEALTAELGSVDAAKMAWEDYNKVLEGSLDINKDLLKQKKENPPMTYEDYVAMIEHEQEGLDLLNKGFFDKLAKTNGTTREQEMLNWGYNPKVTQQALNNMYWSQEEFAEFAEEYYNYLELQKENDRLLREREAEIEKNAKTNKKLTETVEEQNESVKKSADITEKSNKSVKAHGGYTHDAIDTSKRYTETLEEQAEVIEETQEAVEQPKKHYDYLNADELNKILKKIQNGSKELSDAEKELITHLNQANFVEGMFATGEKRKQAIKDFGILEDLVTTAYEVMSNPDINGYLKSFDKIEQKAEETAETVSDTNNKTEKPESSLIEQMPKQWRDVLSNVSDIVTDAAEKGLSSVDIDLSSILAPLGEDFSKLFKSETEGLDLKIPFNFDDLKLTDENGKLLKPEEIVDQFGVESVVLPWLTEIGLPFSDLGGLPNSDEFNALTFIDDIKNAIDEFNAGDLFTDVAKLFDWFNKIGKKTDDISDGIDDINNNPLDPKVNSSELSAAEVALENIRKQYALLGDEVSGEEVVLKKAYQKLVNGEWITQNEKSVLEKFYNGVWAGTFGNDINAARDWMEARGINWDLFLSFYSQGLDTFTSSAKEYARILKETGIGEYTSEQLIKDIDLNKWGDGTERKEAMELAGLSYERAQEMYKFFKENGMEKFLEKYAEDYAIITDEEKRLAEEKRRADVALATTPEGAFKSIGDFLNGVNTVIADKETAEKFSNFINDIVETLKSVKLENAPAFEAVGNFLKMVKSVSSGPGYAGDFKTFVDGIKSTLEDLGSTQISNPEGLETITNLMQAVSVDNSDAINSITGILNAIKEFGTTTEDISLMSVAISELIQTLNTIEVGADTLAPISKVLQAMSDLSSVDISAQAAESANTIVNSIIEVFEGKYDKFTEIGRNFIIQLVNGMLSQQQYALAASETIAGTIVGALQDQAVAKAADIGQEFVQNLIQYLASDEAISQLNTGFNALFGVSQEGVDTGASGLMTGMMGMTGGTESIGMRVGKAFATDFMSGFISNMSFGSGETFTGILDATSNLMTQMSTLGTEGGASGANMATLLIDFAESAKEAIEGDAGQEIQKICEHIQTVIKDSVPDGYQLGLNFVQGLRDGLQVGWDTFGAEIQALAGMIGAAASVSLGQSIQSASPSRVTMRYGGYFVEGFKIGIEKSADSVYDSGAKLGENALEGTRDALGIHSPSDDGIDTGENFGNANALGMMKSFNVVYDAGYELGEQMIEGTRTSLIKFEPYAQSLIDKTANSLKSGFSKVPDDILLPDFTESINSFAEGINEYKKNIGDILRNTDHFIYTKDAAFIKGIWDDVMRGKYGVVGDPLKDRNKMLWDEYHLTWDDLYAHSNGRGGFSLSDRLNYEAEMAEKNALRLKEENASIKDIVEEVWKGSLGTGQARIDAFKFLGLDPDFMKNLVANMKFNPGSINWGEVEYSARGEENPLIGESFVDNVKNNLEKGISLMSQKIPKVTETAKEIVKDVTNTFTEKLNIDSPSKLFMEFGRFIDEGLAIGIHDNTFMVTDNINGLSDALTSTFNETVIGLSSLVEDELNTDPVIRPVIDMSSVTESARSIDSMLSREQAVAISTSQNTEKLQNGDPNSEVGATYNFTQNNYSPKALSRSEIYRQTRNQFAMLKGAPAL